MDENKEKGDGPSLRKLGDGQRWLKGAWIGQWKQWIWGIRGEEERKWEEKRMGSVPFVGGWVFHNHKKSHLSLEWLEMKIKENDGLGASDRNASSMMHPKSENFKFTKTPHNFFKIVNHTY